MENKLVLGLDVSTTTIGISLALVDKGNNVIPVDVTHLRLKIDKDLEGAEALFVKTNLFLEKMREYNDRYVISDIVIEEPLISSNNSYTVSSLLKFNGMISFAVYNMFGIVPQYISSYDARKYGMPELMAIRKFNKKGEAIPAKMIKKAIKDNDLVLFGSYPYDVGKKEVLWNWISEKFPEINWVTNKKGELKKENFDASDSLMCVLGFVNKCVYGDTDPQIIESHEDEDGNITYSTSFCGQIFTKTVNKVESVRMPAEDDEYESQIIPTEEN